MLIFADREERFLVVRRMFGKRLGVSSPINEISLLQEKLSELLEKLAVAREVARGIFSLHLSEQCARLVQYFVARSRRRRACSGGCRRRYADEEALGIR